MREKTEQIVLTFHDISAAIHAEAMMKNAGIEGRLIPVPRQISASCGMAWKSPITEREAINRLLEGGGMDVERETTLMLY